MNYDDSDESSSFYSQEAPSPQSKLKDLESNHSSIMKKYQELSKSKSDAIFNQPQKKQHQNLALDVSALQITTTSANLINKVPIHLPQRSHNFPLQMPQPVVQLQHENNPQPPPPQQCDEYLQKLVENYKANNKELSQKLDEERVKVLDQRMQIQGLETDVKFSRRENTRLTSLLESISQSSLSQRSGIFVGATTAFQARALTETLNNNNNSNNQSNSQAASSSQQSSRRSSERQSVPTIIINNASDNDNHRIIAQDNNPNESQKQLVEVNSRLEAQLKEIQADQIRTSNISSQRIELLEREIACLKETNAELRNKYDSSEEEHKQVINKFNVEVSHLQQDLLEARKRNTSTDPKLEEMQIALQNSNERCTQKDIVINELQNKIRQFMASHETMEGQIQLLLLKDRNQLDDRTDVPEVGSTDQHNLHSESQQQQQTNSIDESYSHNNEGSRRDSLEKELKHAQDNSELLTNRINDLELFLKEKETLIEELLSQKQSLSDQLQKQGESKDASVTSLAEENTFLQDRLENALKQNELYSNKLTTITTGSAAKVASSLQQQATRDQMSLFTDNQELRITTNEQDARYYELVNQQEFILNQVKEQAQVITQLQDQLRSRSRTSSFSDRPPRDLSLSQLQQLRYDENENHYPKSQSSNQQYQYPPQRKIPRGLTANTPKDFNSIVKGKRADQESSIELNPTNIQLSKSNGFSSNVKGRTPLQRQMSNQNRGSYSSMTEETNQSFIRTKQPFVNPSLRSATLVPAAGQNNAQEDNKQRPASVHSIKRFSLTSESKPKKASQCFDDSIYLFSSSSQVQSNIIPVRGGSSIPQGLQYRGEGEEGDISVQNISLMKDGNISQYFEQASSFPNTDKNFKGGIHVKYNKSMFKHFNFTRENILAFKKGVFLNKSLCVETAEGLQIGCIRQQVNDEFDGVYVNLTLYYKNISTNPIIHLNVNLGQTPYCQTYCKPPVVDWVLKQSAQSKQDITFKLISLPIGPIVAEVSYRRQDVQKNMEVYLPINIISFLENRIVNIDRLLEKYVTLKSQPHQNYGVLLRSERFALDRKFALNINDFLKYLPHFVEVPSPDQLGEFLIGGSDFKIAGTFFIREYSLNLDLIFSVKTNKYAQIDIFSSEATESKHFKTIEYILNCFVFLFINSDHN